MKISRILENNFCNDTRILKKNDVFFDLVSNKNKKNPFIKTAIKKKPRLIVTQQECNYDKILKVKNIKNFYFSLIKKKYKDIPNNLYAVTGTNGKSSVAGFFYQINILNKLSCANIGTLGFHSNKYSKQNYLTTPDNLNTYKFLNYIKSLKINRAIIEASSHGLHQGRLNKLKFNGVVFTNFSRDHLDYHKSMRSYFNAKLIIFKQNLKKNSDIICDDKIAKLIKKKNIKKDVKFILQSKNKNLIKIIGFKPQGSKTKVKINYNNKVYNIVVNIIGKFQIENLFQAIILSVSSGISVRNILKVLPRVKPINGRLNILKNKKKTVCLDYAHTPDGLEKVITTLENHFKKKVNIVFGCGGNRDKGKRVKMAKIASKLCKKIIVTDDNPRDENAKEITKQIFKYIKKGQIINNRRLAIKKAIDETNLNEVLLVAGKGHENYQIINGKQFYFSDRKEIIKYL
tara:strand:- start:5761 stop:7134 length:1374 start_codon:yes stop_codon:yes gene_type:complete